MAANYGLVTNDMERLAPAGPLVGEPQPEETLEAPELRSFRLAAKQDELLAQREVLEREVSAGSERRTQRAQQNDYEGHCLPGSHTAGSSSRPATGFWQTTAWKGAKITQPSFYIAGRADGLGTLYPPFEKLRVGFTGLVGNLELDNVGHWVQHEASAEVSEQLVKFLRTVNPA